MADRPITFSAPMVQALLSGRKTQTRLVLKPQPAWGTPEHYQPMSDEDPYWAVFDADHVETRLRIRYAPGDRLYVKEAWRPTYDAEGWREDLARVARPSDFDPKMTAIEYLADGTNELGGNDRPARYMPRWASRLTLTVTEVRVQRLQEISEDDAVAEGCAWSDLWEGYTPCPNPGDVRYFNSRSAVRSFEKLWSGIHGPGAWDANLWVRALSFKTARKNIDGHILIGKQDDGK